VKRLEERHVSAKAPGQRCAGTDSCGRCEAKQRHMNDLPKIAGRIRATCFLFQRCRIAIAVTSLTSLVTQIRVLRPSLQQNSLRFIHSGRLLTDGILLLPWLRALENRLQSRQDAEDIGLAGVVRGLAGETDEVSTSGKGKGKEREEKVWLHCVVGAKAEERPTDAETTDEQVRS
jgi:hypothetical protein